MAVIELDKVNKTYSGKNGSVHALKEVSLSVEEGEIFGVIGLSGAGKSTLVRCINLLERPETGEIRVEGREITSLSERELRLERQNIAMIFQQFNLLMQRTVLDNVCFPLEIAGLRKKEARKQALEYLRTVGLEDKAKAYPVQLSGGQQQRVAIARALASHPRIILCDEATSALDPQTTRTILELLRRVNREYHISIVIITHEMRVITEICDRVAVLHHGSVAETGPVQEVFNNPKSKAARQLLVLRESEQLEEELTEDDEKERSAGRRDAGKEQEDDSDLRVIRGGAHAVS